ncbi:MAG: hypothetical protein JXA52_00445, partial [Planctomycetes bacterium]|nr:hypothetical protein [Planctomycetota bacterium]
MSEWDKIQEYVKSGSESAFTELVREHIDLVHSAALRQVGDAHLAEDVTQAVFLTLSRKAGSLRRGLPLAAWLYQVTRYTAANACRQRSRRMRHEEAAGKERVLEQDESRAWEEVAPYL